MGPTDKPETCVYTISTDTARPEDGGEWRCELSNSYGKSSATCFVKVLGETEIGQEQSPSFVEVLKNTTVVEDGQLTFRCRISGKPTPDVKWFRDDIPIDNEDPSMGRITITSEEGGWNTLAIKEIKVRDAGVFKCKIKNLVGWATCDAKLFVQESPEEEYPAYSKPTEYTLVDKIKERHAEEMKNEADTLINSFVDCAVMRKFLIKWQLDDDPALDFITHLKSKCAVEGTSVMLNCLVKGTPPFKVRWYKNNKEIFETGKYFIRNQQGILSLEILRVEESDTANYMCEIRTIQGKIFTSCYVQAEPVLELTNEVPVKPFFIKPMKRLTVNEGELIRFRVTVKAYPAPGFKWYKDGLEIHDNNRISTEVLPNGVAQLVIANSSVRDIGLYTCEAHNLAGRAKSMVRISVRDKHEAEMWKARSLNGVEVTTKGKSGQITSISNGCLDTSYTQRQESEVYPREPLFNRTLPRTISIKDRGSFLLECSCNGCLTPTVTWYKDGKELKNADGYHFLSIGDYYGLEILEALPTNAGTYSVKIENRAGEIMSSCVVEMKLPTEHAKDLLTPTELAETLSSSSDGHVVVSTEETHQPFDLAQIVPSFHLCNTEIDWSACIEKEVEVIDAAESPSFVRTLPDKVTPLDNEENVTLQCQASGYPTPKCVWFKDGEQLKPSDNITTAWDSSTHIATLVFKKMGAADAGNYSCVAYSDLGGHATTATDVQIREVGSNDENVLEAAGKSSVPEFKVKLHDTEATPGSEVKLECVAKGYPAPNVKWYKNEEPIEPDTDRCTITEGVEGTFSLLIGGVHVSDSDCYKCEAVNECGAVSTHAHVVVQEQCEVPSPDKGDVQPSFIEQLHSVTSTVGQDPVFKCSAKGTPTPDLKWKKDGKEIQSSGRFTISVKDGESTLEIKAVTLDDAGYFICIAENSSGRVETTASLKVTGDATVTDKGETSAKTVDPDLVTRNIEKTEQTTNADSNVKVETQKENATGIQSDETGSKDRPEESIPMCDNVDDKENIPTTELVKDASASKSNENQQHEVVSSSETLKSDEKKTSSMDAAPSSLTLTNYKKFPKFILHPLSQWVASNSALNISCEATKSSGLEVNWFHNGEVVSGDRFKMEIKEQSFNE